MLLQWIGSSWLQNGDPTSFSSFPSPQQSFFIFFLSSPVPLNKENYPVPPHLLIFMILEGKRSWRNFHRRESSETGSVSIFRWGEGDTNSAGSLTIEVSSSKGLNCLSPVDKNRPSLWNTVFSSYLEIRTMDKVQKPSGPEYDSLQHYDCMVFQK
jgi:hypothetical protein